MIESIRSIGVALVVIASFASLCHGMDPGILSADGTAEQRTSGYFAQIGPVPGLPPQQCEGAVAVAA